MLVHWHLSKWFLVNCTCMYYNLSPSLSWCQATRLLFWLDLSSLKYWDDWSGVLLMVKEIQTWTGRDPTLSRVHTIFLKWLEGNVEDKCCPFYQRRAEDPRWLHPRWLHPMGEWSSDSNSTPRMHSINKMMSPDRGTLVTGKGSPCLPLPAL